MILRFAAETEMDTSLRGLAPAHADSLLASSRSPRCAPPSCRCRSGSISSKSHPGVKSRFEYEVMKLMSEVMAHTITLHLLDAPGRLSRFHRKHPDLAGRIPKKELAAYLNLTPETLSPAEAEAGTKLA